MSNDLGGEGRGGSAFGSRYTLENLLGRGSMGRVYRGQTRDTGEQVAIKVLRDDLASQPEIVARFIQERQVLRAVNHPNVVGVRDLVVEGEQLGIIMDLVPGGDLRTAITIPMRADQALAIICEIADGLAAVHAANVVHRDLKPENVLADRWPDGRLRPRLTDFGVSRLISQSMTKVTSLIGTPGYLSPEAAHGQSVEAPADIYALGVMLYEMVCDRPPFRADNVIALIRAHAQDDVPRPGNMPDNLWSLLHSMLAKEPAQRPTATQIAATARQLAPTLTNAGPYTVVAATPTGSDDSATLIRPAHVPAATTPAATTPAVTVLRAASAPAGPSVSHGDTAPPGTPPAMGGPPRNRKRRNALIGAGAVLALGAAALAAFVVTSSSRMSDDVSPAAAAADSTVAKSTQQSPSTSEPTSAPVRNAVVTDTIADTGTVTTVTPRTTQPALTETTRRTTSAVEQTTTTARPTTTTTTTTTAPPTAPAAPTVYLSSTGLHTMSIGWASNGTGNRPFDHYELTLSSPSGGSATFVRRNVGDLTAHNARFLTEGTQYCAEVRAYNTAGLYGSASRCAYTDAPQTTTTTTTAPPPPPSPTLSTSQGRSCNGAGFGWCPSNAHLVVVAGSNWPAGVQLSYNCGDGIWRYGTPWLGSLGTNGIGGYVFETYCWHTSGTNQTISVRGGGVQRSANSYW